MNESKTLVIDDVCKEFPTRAEPLKILQGVSIELAAGESLAIMGPSGSGKSTLLHILGTLEKPSSGTVLLEGFNPFELPEAELAAFRNQRIGFVFQEHHLLPQCSVLENVLLPTVINASSEDSEERARTLLEKVGLTERLDHRPAELSGGERQRAAIARAIINGPSLLLCDEPTGNLDRNNAEAVGALFLSLCEEEQVATVLATHSLALARRFPRKMELADGRLRPFE